MNSPFERPIPYSSLKKRFAKGLAMAMKEYEKFKDDPKLRDLAERREKFLRDVNSSRLTAIRRARAEGEARGIAEGKAVGIVDIPRDADDVFAPSR